MTCVSQLIVQVFDHEGGSLQKAKVTLRPRSGQGKSLHSSFSPEGGGYIFEGLSRGHYVIDVGSRGLEPQTRNVDVNQSEQRERFHLGKKGALYYFRGQVRIPVNPPEGLVAASVRSKIDKKGEEALYKLASELGLEVVETGETIQGELVRVFRTSKADLVDRGREILDRLSANDLVRRSGFVLSLSEDSVTFLTDEIIVQFTEKGDEKTRKASSEDGGYEVLRWLPYSPRTAVIRVSAAADFAVLEACEHFLKRDDVVFAEPNLVTTVVPDVTPNDFLFANQPNHGIIGTEDAWDVTFGSEDIIIAVVDTGCDVDHPDFVTPDFTKIYQPFDFAGVDTNVFNNSSSHGTQSCGIASAVADNAEGVSGVAPGCQLMPIRWPSGGTDTDYADMYVWIAGLDPASATPGFPAVISPGADVISNSFGLGQAAISGTMSNAFDTITDDGRGGLGCVVVYSVGNNNVDFTTGNGRRWAEYDRTIAVASSRNSPPDAAEVKVSTSSFGPALDVCAPGGGPGGSGETRVMSAVNVGTGNTAGSATAASNDYRTFGQTSCACPQVSGVAALVLSACPDLTWNEVRDIIRDTADRIDVDNNDPVGQWVDNDGDGFPEFSQWYGYGRINAAAAVLEARRCQPIIAVNLEQGMEFSLVCGGPGHLTLQVFNVGEAELVINDVFVAGGGPVFEVDPLPLTPLVIDPGSEVDFTVRYTPSAQGASDSAVLRIESNDPLTPEYDLDLSGEGGIATAALAIANAGDFGTVCEGEFVDRGLSVNNSGTCPLVVTAINSTDPAFIVPMVVDFPLVVAAGDTINLPLRFQPTASGAASSTISVLSNDPESPAAIEVSGTRGEPRLVLSFVDEGDFGATCVGNISDKPLLISNSGDCDLRINSIASSDADFVVPEVIAFPLVIGAGASASVTLRFQPTSLGEKSATIMIASNDPASPAALDVSGTAPSGKLTLTGTTQFCEVELGDCARETLSICNTGDCDLQVERVAFKEPDPCVAFMYGNCGCDDDCSCGCDETHKPKKRSVCDQKCLGFKILGNPFPATVKPGSCLGVTIEYRPNCEGSSCCQLMIESDDPDLPKKSVFVTGRIKRTLHAALKCWAGQELSDALSSKQKC
ncbi:MAG: S8 family serine peptidase [Paracoccaceae bacterium]